MQNRFMDYITHVGSAMAIFYLIFHVQFSGTGATVYSLITIRASIFSVAATLVFWGLVKLSRELFNRRHLLTLRELNEGSDIAIKVR